jgi:hypothetical protein
VPRDFQITGESLVLVKGAVDTAFPTLTQLGLPFDRINVQVQYKNRDMNLDAWGGEVPPDTQIMLAMAIIRINLIHFDPAVLAECSRLAMGGGNVYGAVGRAGTRMGGPVGGLAQPRFGAGNKYVGLNIAVPTAVQVGTSQPYCFLYSQLIDAIEMPLGVEKQILSTTWRAIPYTTDPAGIVNGVVTGATNALIWTNVLDT